MIEISLNLCTNNINLKVFSYKKRTNNENIINTFFLVTKCIHTRVMMDPHFWGGTSKDVGFSCIRLLRMFILLYCEFFNENFDSVTTLTLRFSNSYQDYYQMVTLSKVQNHHK